MQIIGHRGARGEAPENTLGGFAYLHNLGIRAVEFDVRQLTDGQLVVMHDDNFLRTAGTDYPLYACAPEDLARFNQAQHFTGWLQHETTPKLEQVLAVLSDFEHIEVEVKTVNSPAEAERLVSCLVPLLGFMQDQITITSFDFTLLEALQRQAPHFRRGLLAQLPLGEAIIDIAQQLGCSRIGLKDALATRPLVEKIRQQQLQCSVWTVNGVERARELASWPIDGLITDVPALMQAHGIGT